MKNRISLAVAMLMALGLIFVFAGGVSAEEKKALPRVAVKQLGGKGVDADTAATLTDVLCTRLMTHKKYNVICASDVAAILQATQQTALLGSCEDGNCYEIMGKVLKAPYIVSGTIGKVGGSTVITISLIGTGDQKVIKRITHEIGPKDSLIKGVRKAVDLMVK